MVRQMSDLQSTRLERVRLARERMEESREEYRAAMLAADEVGVTFTALAKVAGTSVESARRFVQRNREGRA